MPVNDESGFEKGVRITSNILVYVCMGMLLVMMLLGAADVIGRQFFSRPIVGMVEIFEILLVGIILLGLAYTQRIKAHVRVELFYSRLRPKRQAIVGLSTTLWVIIMFAIIAWRGTLVAMLTKQHDRLISNLGVPIYPFQLFVPLGALAIILVLVVDVLHFIAEIRKAG